MQILLTFAIPPEGMNPSQLFHDVDHLESWLFENEALLPDFEITETKLTYQGGSAKVELKPVDFNN